MADNNDDLDRPSFDVVSLPGKGLALVAKRDIHVGEIVVREKPTIVMPNQVQSELLFDLTKRNEVFCNCKLFALTGI